MKIDHNNIMHPIHKLMNGKVEDKDPFNLDLRVKSSDEQANNEWISLACTIVPILVSIGAKC